MTEDQYNEELDIIAEEMLRLSNSPHLTHPDPKARLYGATMDLRMRVMKRMEGLTHDTKGL